MPHLRGITVHITDSCGKAFQEWGIQYLRQHKGGMRVSACVESTTNVSFQVSLQPNIPFIEHDPPSDTLESAKTSTRKKSRRLPAGSTERSTEQNYEKGDNETLSPPIRSPKTPQSHSAPDFALLALLYLDGREKPERKMIVYTDPTDKDFSSPNGKVAFKHRWVRSADGSMIELAWVFKETDIETVFGKLMIAGSHAGIEDQDDDALIKAMEFSGLDAQGKTEKVRKAGQIVVKLQRVVLGEKRTEANYRPRHQEGQDEDIDTGGGQREISHTTGFIHKNTLRSQPLRVVDYWPYEPNEDSYATFQFFYRSREQLQKFQFPGFPSLTTTKTARTARSLNTRMADLTPLSISLPLGEKTKKMRCENDSYEAKIVKRGFKPDDSQKYGFGSEYRDIRAISPSADDGAYEGKELPKYPTAPSPFLDSRSFENTNIDNHFLKTMAATAAIPLLADNSLALEPKHRLRSQGNAHQTLNISTPISIIAETSSSAPSSTGVQMANITDKDDYRLTARDCYPSDQEGNPDEEHGTESDLETHVDDDDVSYAAVPEDDECYDSLQSRFKNVRICKRRRDDVEDAEDGNEAWQGTDAALLQGGRKQKTQDLPLTKELGAHRGKKSRTAKETSGADGSQDVRSTENRKGVP